MPDADDRAALLAEVATTLSPLQARVRRDGIMHVADIAREDGTIIWPNYARGPSETLAILAAEQRFLVEDRATGAVSGATFVDKARERLRRWESQR